MKNNADKSMRWKFLLTTTLLAGTLDITAAFLNAWLSNGVMPDRVLAYIASGIAGKAAYTGGFVVLMEGLLFHFIIVFACVFCFFEIYPKWSFLHKSIALNALLIALVAWLVTTRVVIRLSKITARPFQISDAFIAVGILIICIGLPIAYAAKWFYKENLKE